MKFWQKVFFPTLLLFLLLLNGSLYMLSSVTYRKDLELEKSRTASEQYSFAISLSRDISVLRDNGRLTSANAIRVMSVYSNSYSDEDVYLRLYTGEELLFSNTYWSSSVPLNGARGVTVTSLGDDTLIYAWGQLPEQAGYTVVYIRSIREMEKIWDGLQQLYLAISLTASVILALLLLVLVSKVTRPLTRLAEAANEIAAGNYDKRVFVQGRDELAQLTSDFNHMAGEIHDRVRQLQEESQKKQRFLDNFTHELRTPLTNIYGYSEIMLRTVFSEEDRMRYLQYMMRESKRLNQMSVELFNLTVLQNSEIERRTVSCQALMAAAVQTLERKAAQKQVKMTFTGSELALWGSWALLESLVVNLCENALRACRPGDRVRVSFHSAENCPVLQVTDSGIGMEREELSRIAEPFYRVDRARSRAEGGVGLGLYLCSEIARLHGASIEFQSGPGAGTTVTVRFPPPPAERQRGSGRPGGQEESDEL